MFFWCQVYIVLYGDKGVSQTRELSDPDHTLFTCNSRATFILRYQPSGIFPVEAWKYFSLKLKVYNIFIILYLAS